jgi:hypothetical protein
MFLRKMFGKKQAPVEPPVEKLSLGSLESRVRELEQERLSQVQPKLNDLLARLSKERTGILNELKILSQAETTEVVHPGLYKTVFEARRLVVEKLTRSLEDFPQQRDISNDSLASLDEKLTKVVNNTTDAINIHGRYVRLLFSPRLNSVQLRMQQFHALVKEIHAVIKETLDRTHPLESLLSKTRSQVELLRQIDSMQSETKSLAEQATKLEDIIKTEDSQLNQLVGSEEFKQAISLESEVQQVGLEIEDVKNAVSNTFSSVNRPLRKMENLVASGKLEMDRDLVKSLEQCTHEPLSALSSNEKITTAQSLLQRLLDLLKEGKIDLDEREREKRMEITRDMLQGQRLVKFKEQLEKLKETRDAKSQVLGQMSIFKRRVELEKSIEEHRSKLKRVQATIEELNQKLKAAQQDSIKNKDEIEQMASQHIGSKVEIIS